MAWAEIAQIDGAHNANATAREAWKVRPELMVQHAINSMFSVKAGMKKKKTFAFQRCRQQHHQHLV